MSTVKNKVIAGSIFLALAAATNASEKSINITTTVAGPWSLNGSVKVHQMAEVGASFSYSDDRYQTEWGDKNQTVDVNEEHQGYSVFVRFSPNEALKSGPMLRLDLSYLNERSTLPESNFNWFEPNEYFTCELNTEAVSSGISIGYQWFTQIGLNASVSTGYNHHWKQDVDSRCSNNDQFTEAYYETRFSDNGSVMVDLEVGWAF